MPMTATNTPSRLHVITWGCQMNVYDSGRMRRRAGPAGLRPAAAPEGADMVILNTCHIRDRAAEKVFSELGRLRVMKQGARGPGPPHDPRRRRLRGPGGRRRDRGARALCGHRARPADLPPPAREGRPRRPRRRRRDRDRLPRRTEIRLPAEASAPQGVSAFLTVPGGLRQVLQLLRGPLHARRRGQPPQPAVLAEARRLAAQGTREITLLGQNVNAWHGEAHDGRPSSSPA